MQTDHHGWLSAVGSEGAAFESAARRAGLAAPVPSCPDWTVADLVTHLGSVHRWVGEHVGRGVTEPFPFRTAEPDGDPLEWYRAGLAGLRDRLSRTDPALPAWNFSRTAPMVAGFWPRRMAHETAVHRWDAELAGGRPGGFDPGLAADGVGEVLESLMSRRTHREPLASALGTVWVGCTDTGDGWRVTLTPGRVDTVRLPAGQDGGACDATISGPAGQVYLVLWGRRPLDTVTVTGDSALAALTRTR